MPNAKLNQVQLKGDGRIYADFGLGAGLAYVVKLQSDGKIVVAGGKSDFVVARFNSNGTPDANFGTNGISVVDTGAAEQIKGLFIQADAKIMVAGSSLTNGILTFSSARLTSGGVLDKNFSSDGIFNNTIGGLEFAVTGLISQNGKIIIAGSSGSDFSLIRYNTDGSIDNTFSGDGVSTISLGGRNQYIKAIHLQDDGKLIAAGPIFSGRLSAAGWQYTDSGLIRINSDGSLDTTFGANGVVPIDFGGRDYANAVGIQPDGKILVAGRSDAKGSYDFFLARYNSDGSLDSTFDDDGKLFTAFAYSSDDRVEAIAIQADGKILLAGSSSGAFAVARYNVNGSLDTSFSNDGLVTIDFGIQSSAYSITIQKDNRILIAGGSYYHNFAVSRLNNDGSLDTSFYDGRLDDVANGTPLDDEISGLAGNDTLSGLAGDDTLLGGDGDDTVRGGLGNDTLRGGAGSDTVTYVDSTAGVSVDLSLVTPQNTKGAGLDMLSGFENLTGSNFADALAGDRFGNMLLGLGGDDVLIGHQGDDTLIGGAGKDRMFGGAGNDTYYVNGTGDLVYETATAQTSDTINLGGIDTVIASVSHTLSKFVETLTLTGSAKINGVGNDRSNTISGNDGINILKGLSGDDTLAAGAGNDKLYGGDGRDILTGGTGKDSFVFDTAPTSRDTITDFSRTDGDKIQLSKAVFTGFAYTGTLRATDFYAAAGATKAQDANDRIIYDTTTGKLYYDADGIDGLAAVQVAQLGASTHPALVFSDLQIIA